MFIEYRDNFTVGAVRWILVFPIGDNNVILDRKNIEIRLSIHVLPDVITAAPYLCNV